MQLIKDIFIDSLNGFPVHLIPLFLFQIICAGLLGFLVQFVLKKKWSDSEIQNGALISVAIAVITSIVKYSLPFAVIGAAAILLLGKGQQKSQVDLAGLFLIVIAGIGCGVGSVIQTIIGFAIIFAVILFIPLKK